MVVSYISGQGIVELFKTMMTTLNILHTAMDLVNLYQSISL